MRFERLVRSYLADFQDKCDASWDGGSASVELATRPAVHNFLEKLVKSISKDIRVDHDTKAMSTRDRPDWRLQSNRTLGVYAYGDHKNLNLNSPLSLSQSERKQVERYLKLGRPVFVFDGIEFLFFDSSVDNPRKIALLEKPLTKRKRWADLPLKSTIVDHLRQVLRAAGKQKWTEQSVVRQLAVRARDLSDSLEHRLAAPSGSGVDRAEEIVLTVLRNLKESLTKHHDLALHSNRACADFVAQVIAFSLLYAQIAGDASSESPIDARKRIIEFWRDDRQDAKALLLFRAVSKDLESLLRDGGLLEDWYLGTATFLAHVEYRGRRSRPDDFHALFEAFFEAFDHTTKFDRGAFFTPKELANWMARMSRDLIRKHFTSASSRNRLVTIIDPCCGTGGILEAVIAESDSRVKDTAKFIGFEILPAPYALAQYRLREMVRAREFENRLDILLTDTLADELLSAEANSVVAIGKERERAHHLAIQPLHIVIGNPPSSDHVVSKASRKKINAILDDFRPPQSERRARQNIQKALNNEALRFLRWGAERVLNAGSGILALAMPGSFAFAPSYRWARKWLLQRFNAVYVMHLDRDSRTGEKTNSLFNVLQGRLVLFAVLDEADRCETYSDTMPQVKASNQIAPILEWDISTRSIDEKIQALTQGEPIQEFCTFESREPAYVFTRERDSKWAREWEVSWPLIGNKAEHGVFVSKCSGLKLSPTSLLFHVDDRVLRRRTGEVGAREGATFTYSSDKLLMNWWLGQRKPPRDEKLTPEVRKAMRGAIETDSGIASYSYRPFLNGHVLLNDEVLAALGRSPGGGTRARPEIRAAFGQGACGIAVAPNPVDLGPSLTRFASFAWSIPDNDLSARGNAMIYCDRFPAEKRTRRCWSNKVRSNISESLRQAFGVAASDQDVVFYVYALLSSQEYLSRFATQLFSRSASSAMFRVPVFRDRSKRERLVVLGKGIAECERQDLRCQLAPFLKLQWLGPEREFSLTANAEINRTAGTIQLSDAHRPKVAISGIPGDVLQLRIGGHDVVSKWLRERKQVYLRRAITAHDVQGLLSVLSRIAKQLELIAQVDKFLSKELRVENLIAPDVRK